MRVVIDTNVIVSGLINPHGSPARIINMLLNESIIILYDNRILEEYSEVLSRKEFNFNKNNIQVIIEYIKTKGEFIPALPLQIKFKDIGDKPFYEVALTGEADYLITGNKKHFLQNKKEIKIVPPERFLSKYFAEY